MNFKEAALRVLSTVYTIDPTIVVMKEKGFYTSEIDLDKLNSSYVERVEKKKRGNVIFFEIHVKLEDGRKMVIYSTEENLFAYLSSLFRFEEGRLIDVSSKDGKMQALLELDGINIIVAIGGKSVSIEIRFGDD